MYFNQKPKNSIWQTLILQNCLPLSQPAKFTSKNITQYLLGSRNTINIFKYDHLRHLLLRITPLIQTLFHSHTKIKNKVGRYTFFVPPIPPKDPTKFIAWEQRMKESKIKAFKKKRHYYKTVANKKPVKILFATTNPIYNKIIESAANLCNMPFHTHRWLCGSLTANSQYIKIPSTYKKIKNEEVKKMTSYFRQKYSSNKEVPEKRYYWHELQKKSQRPTVVIIPDIQNNDMILRETKILQIPVIGLVNSDCATQVTYPIFGNANSVQIVHFFCHFIAVLIAKEFIQQDYKKKSHRIFAKTRWLLRKDFFKIDRFAVKTRKIPQVISIRCSRISKKNNKKWNKFFQTLKKKKFKNRRRKNIWMSKLSKISKKQRRLQKHFRNLNFHRRKKSGYIHFKKILKRKMRKRFNKISAHRFHGQKNLSWLIFTKQFFTEFDPNPNQIGQLSVLLTLKLLFLLQHPNMNKNKLYNFFHENPALTYMTKKYLQQYPRALYQDAHKKLFFESHLNTWQKRSPFVLSWFQNETLVSNESIWRNAYWTYFRAQKKENKVKAYPRWRKKTRRFRGKIRFVRINKPYNWRSTNLLVINHRIKRLTQMFVKTQHRIYRDIRKEYWTSIAWYFDRKKRRRLWIHWRFTKNLINLSRRLKLKKRHKKKNRYKANGWKKKNYKNPSKIQNTQQLISKFIHKNNKTYPLNTNTNSVKSNYNFRNQSKNKTKNKKW